MDATTRKSTDGQVVTAISKSKALVPVAPDGTLGASHGAGPFNSPGRAPPGAVAFVGAPRPDSLGLLGFVLIVLGYAHATSLPIDLLATGVLLPLYGTSRTRHHTLAATLTVIAVPTSVFIYGTFDSKGNLLDFLVLGVVLSSLFLSKRSTVVVFAVSLLGIPVLSLLPTQVPFVDVLDEWFLIACVGALAIVTGGLRQHDLRQIEQQSRELADDIAKRRRVEEALNQSNEKLVETVKTLEQHNSEITLLNQMGDLLQTCLMSQEAHAVVAQFAQRLFPDQPGALGIINYSRNLVEVVAVWGEPLPSDRAFAPDDCLALRRGQAYTVTDPARD